MQKFLRPGATGRKIACVYERDLYHDLTLKTRLSHFVESRREIPSLLWSYGVRTYATSQLRHSSCTVQLHQKFYCLPFNTMVV